MTRPLPRTAGPATSDPWPALWALVIGFFMIMLDTTIVSVATPALIEDLGAEVNDVVWVTSAYLLAYAVPVLITGRLGDRYGQKQVYLIGLVLFTAASLWCGLTSTVGALIVARVFQGLGAAVMNPQTLAIITRIFPSERRGQASSLWAATAGLAMLLGPLMGGVLVDAFGWEWIFIVNVPVGIAGFVLAWRWVPSLPTHDHRFDWWGVMLSGAGMFLLVFGIQEGHQFGWNAVIWTLIGLGSTVLGGFVLWQANNRHEPLVPLDLFGIRNFSMANIGVAAICFASTAMAFPLMLYLQVVRGDSPTRAGLILAPMAVLSMVLAPLLGKMIDHVHPRTLIATGFGLSAVAHLWLCLVMSPEAATWQLLLPITLLGLGNAAVWSPLTATATRDLPLHQAGAGAGVYNTVRNVGGVVGAAAIAVLMDARLAAEGIAYDAGQVAALPERAELPFSDAMAQSLLLPPLILLGGLVAALFFVRPRGFARAPGN